VHRKTTVRVIDPDDHQETTSASQSGDLVILGASPLFDQIDSIGIAQDLLDVCSCDRALGVVVLEVLRVRRVPDHATLVHLFHSIYRSASA